jgi:hypothetical protein
MAACLINVRDNNRGAIGGEASSCGTPTTAAARTGDDYNPIIVLHSPKILRWRGKHQTRTCVSESGYPGGQPKDPESPALASASEQEHSNPGPKVPVNEAARKPVAK